MCQLLDTQGSWLFFNASEIQHRINKPLWKVCISLSFLFFFIQIWLTLKKRRNIKLQIFRFRVAHHCFNVCVCVCFSALREPSRGRLRTRRPVRRSWSTGSEDQTGRINAPSRSFCPRRPAKEEECLTFTLVMLCSCHSPLLIIIQWKPRQTALLRTFHPLYGNSFCCTIQGSVWIFFFFPIYIRHESVLYVSTCMCECACVLFVSFLDFSSLRTTRNLSSCCLCTRTHTQWTHTCRQAHTTPGDGSSGSFGLLSVPDLVKVVVSQEGTNEAPAC